MAESVNVSILNRVVHTLYNGLLSVFYCIMYCYTVFHCFTWPSQLSLECTTTAIRINKIMLHPVCDRKGGMSTLRQVSLTQDWSWTVVEIFFSLTNRGVKKIHPLSMEPTCALYPQKVTIKIAIENKRLPLVQHNVQDFDCPLNAGKKVKVACEMVFISLSIWVIYNYKSVYGRLLSYSFMLNRLLSIFLHIHSPALLHCTVFHLPWLLALSVSQLAYTQYLC